MKVTDKTTQAALDAAGTAADYSARATYQRGYDAGVASVEAREWALGVQVVAQAQRLRLAEAVVGEARYGQPTLAMRRVLAAWDAVPGMEP